MTDYALTGKKGTGKTKHAVILIRDRYLAKGRKVSTNLDIDLKAMFGVYSKAVYVRIPDKPDAFDLEAAGHGNPDSYDEDNNGGMFLDEMATWLNSRSFGDKTRAAVLDYFAHGRKKGYDNWYIMQNIVQIDKQVRESFVEQVCRHTAFKKVRIPFVGKLLSGLFGDRAGYMPNFHRAVFRVGVSAQDLVADSVTYIGKDVESCYDTRQEFKENYPHGTHTVLSPWHLEGRFLPGAAPSFWKSLAGALVGRGRAVGGALSPSYRASAPLVVDAVGVRAAWFARRLPVERRVSFVRRYVAACSSAAALRSGAAAGAAGR